jgi:hypothetical protein
MHLARRAGRTLSVCAFTALVAACAPGQQSLYSWDAYQPGVYAYLNEPAGDYDAQIAELEKNIEKARAKSQALPPGFHAHLGLLYLKKGEDAKAFQEMQTEKLSFPESAKYMDFLLRMAIKPKEGA